MNGYFKNPEATRTAIGPEEWLHTGDLGIIDKNGYLFIKGRSKNMILGPSGQNIYPEEIEDRLNSLPYVSESLVIEHNGKLLALEISQHNAPGIQSDRPVKNPGNRIRKNTQTKHKTLSLPGIKNIGEISSPAISPCFFQIYNGKIYLCPVSNR